MQLVAVPAKKTRKSKKRVPEPLVATPALSADEVASIRAFLNYARGDAHLTAYEENFLNSLKYRLTDLAVPLSDKQTVILGQIKKKLNYDRPLVPLPGIDPAGVAPNDDPDGWLGEDHRADEFEDESLISLLT